MEAHKIPMHCKNKITTIPACAHAHELLTCVGAGKKHEKVPDYMYNDTKN